MNYEIVKRIQLWLVVLLCFTFSHCRSSRVSTAVQLNVTHLLTNGLNNPLGVDEKDPELSWQIESNQRGVVQTSYQILVSSSLVNLNNNIGDYWDSGKITSQEQNHIKYRGMKLKPSTYAYWKVKMWDGNDKTTEWSLSASWLTGLLSIPCKGKWISANPAKPAPSPLFKKVFGIDKPIKQAIMHISGLGYFELYVNGKKAGDHVLDPGETNYDDYALYVTHDVTTLLKTGNNVLGVMLGGGFYNQTRVWGNMSYGKPRLICELDITFSDGSVKQIISDESWKWNNGPIIESNVYAGEIYDARKEIKDWSSDTQIATWMPVTLSIKNPPKLIAQDVEPIKTQQEIVATRFYKTHAGKYIYDMGQNFAGWPRLSVQAHAGDTIKLRMAEEVDADGNLDMRSTGVNATRVEQTDLYICKSDKQEIWEPRFTYHGFRYVEVSGLSSSANTGTIKGIVVRSAVNTAGEFQCSDAQINRLHQMSIWTIVSNLHSIPTDCPTREKCGWLGDAHAVAQASMYNFNMQHFWKKYMYDIRSTGRDTETTIFHVLSNHVFRKGKKEAGIPYMIAPGRRHAGVASIDWGVAVVQLPWNIYQYYGDKDVLTEFYPDMKKWVDYTLTLAKKHIVTEGLGDWCPPGGRKPYDCPVPLTSTAFYYQGLDLFSKISAVLGKTEDKLHYSILRDSVKQAFISEFYNNQLHSYGTQTANAIALDMHLVPAGDEPMLSAAIVAESQKKYDGFIRTGLFGFPRVFGALTNYENDEAAFNILTKKGNNSFENMWRKHNATTFWEALPVDEQFKDNPNISHNHQMQAGFDAWFYDGILGIKPIEDDPGFKCVDLNPSLSKQLTWAKGSYQNPYGLIVSDWSTNHGQFTWKITIPANTTAIIHIPATAIAKVKEGGEPLSGAKDIHFINMENGRVIFKIPSGSYVFTSQ